MKRKKLEKFGDWLKEYDDTAFARYIEHTYAVKYLLRRHVPFISLCDIVDDSMLWSAKEMQYWLSMSAAWLDHSKDNTKICITTFLEWLEEQHERVENE